MENRFDILPSQTHQNASGHSGSGVGKLVILIASYSQRGPDQLSGHPAAPVRHCNIQPTNLWTKLWQRLGAAFAQHNCTGQITGVEGH